MTELLEMANLDPETYLDSLRRNNFSIDMLRKIQKLNFEKAQQCRKAQENCERVAQGVGDIIAARLLGGEMTKETQEPQDAPGIPEPDSPPDEATEAQEEAEKAPREPGFDNAEDDR